MTNLITLTIPNDDHIALRAFGKALEEMALAHGAEPLQLKINEEALSKALDELQQAAPRMMQELRCEDDELQGKRKESEIDTTAQQVEALSQVQHEIKNSIAQNEKSLLTDIDDALEQELAPTTDSTGTPWDERIHSASKALNADGTWRLRRKPKDMDEAEWAAFVESVKGELNECLEVPPEAYLTDDFVKPPVTPSGEEPRIIPEPPVTPPGDDFHTDAGVVTEQTVAGIPPIPVPPPVVVPPVPEFDDGVPFPPSDGVSPALERLVETTAPFGHDYAHWSFPKLMTFLTERQGKIDVATVNMLLAQDGIASLPELNAHPDKIGPFVARVKVHLGE